MKVAKAPPLDFGNHDDEEAEELRNYVAGLRAHADNLCEQLQEEVAVQRSATRSTKHKKDSDWNECIEQDDASWKTRAMKAEKEAVKSRQRAVDAEFRAAALEASTPSGAPGTPLQRELQLEDLLVMFRRMGVKMIVSSKDDELDRLMEDVLDPLNKLAQSNAAQRKHEEDTNCKDFHQAPHAPFSKLIQSVREEIEQSLNKLAEQYAWEMSRDNAEGHAPCIEDPKVSIVAATDAAMQDSMPRPAPPEESETESLDEQGDKDRNLEQHNWEDVVAPEENVEEILTSNAACIEDPLPLFVLENSKGGKSVPELASGLRGAGYGEMPGQVPEERVAQLAKGTCASSMPPTRRGKHYFASQKDQKELLTIWEPELCAVWESLPPDVERSADAALDSKICCMTLPETSRWRFVWDVLCVLIVGYDCVVTPLHVLGLPNNVIFNGMAWVKPAFWLLDMAFSFVSGYVHDGVDELRLSYIACRYGRTWFGLDALLLGLESFTLIMLTHGRFDLLTYEDRRLHGWHALNPTLRKDTVLYALRCLLVLRLLKIYYKMDRRLSWRIQSQAMRIKLGVVNLVSLILLCCHLTACGLYAIGIIYDGQDNSWVWTNLEDKSVGVKYVLSLQWSLAQFTLGTTGVHPGSFGEAAYAAGVTLLAAFLLLILFGRVTAAISELASTSQGKRSKEMSTLMEYLLQCDAPAALRSRIWTTTMERSANTESVGRRIHEDDVPILACLPHRLQDELRAVAFSPTLTAHPLFRELELGLGASQSEGSRTARKLHGGISEVGLRAGQVLFSAGEPAENMYFTAHGNLSYCASIVDAASAKMMSPGPWFSEPSLWINWEHRGEMTAVTYTELFALNAQRFQDMMKQELPEAAVCWAYAKAFATYAEQYKLKLTDVFIDKDALEKLVHTASQSVADHIGEPPDRTTEATERAVVDNQLMHLSKHDDHPEPLVIAPHTPLEQHALVDSII